MDSSEDQKTKEWFGDYVSIYNFQRAIADGATVPLVYENHGALLNLAADETLNQRIVDRIEQARKNGKSEEAIEKLVRASQSEYQFLTAMKRLDLIANDIVKHYKERWKAVENNNSKAMLVCLDRPTSLKMYGLITEKWQALIAQHQAKFDQEREGMPADDSYITGLADHLAWMKATEFAVVVSSEQNENAELKEHKDHRGKPLDITPHREKMQSRKMALEFKDANNPFRFVIVCAMWLTGFDVKSLATLYLDKPMQGHTLMQAIARANRVGGSKKHGLIVDYNGMLQSLRKALSVFAVGQTSSTTQVTVDPLLDDNAPFLDYQQTLQAMLTYLAQYQVPIDALMTSHSDDRAQVLRDCQNALSGSKQTRAEYITRFRDLEQRYNNLLPSTDVLPSKPYLDALRAIYRQFNVKTPIESIAAELQSIQNLINKHLTVEAKAPEQSAKAYHLTHIDFDRLRLEFTKTTHKQTIMLDLQDRIERALQRLIAQNDKRYKFMERYQEILKKMNNDLSDVTIQTIFDELLKVYSDLSEEEVRFVKEGLGSEYELALFDKLDKPKLSKDDREALKCFAKDLLSKIQQKISELRDWTEQESSKETIRMIIFDEIYITDLLPANEFPYEEREQYVDEIFQYVIAHPSPVQMAA